MSAITVQPIISAITGKHGARSRHEIAPDDPFGLMHTSGCQELHICRDDDSGLHAVIAIHSTRLGPALGGCRFVAYPDFSAAVTDAVRLAQGMSYKAAISGLPYGGGKSVIVRPDGEIDRDRLFRRFGRFIESLGGRYVTAVDSGTSVDDMDRIARETKYVTSTSTGDGGTGDPSPITALGVRRGIEAAVREVMGRSALDGISVAIQGVGHVGYHLARELHGAGASLTVSDTRAESVERCVDEFNAIPADTNLIHAVDCDVFSPCALGAVIGDHTLPQIRAAIIAGAANNQLAEPRHADQLAQRGIVYVPDYAINAGGLMHVISKRERRNLEQVRAQVEGIGATVAQILRRAAREGRTTSEIADRMAEEALNG